MLTHFDNSSVLTSNSKPSQPDGQAEVVKNLLSFNQLSSELKSNVAITTNSSQVSHSHSCDYCCSKNVVNDATRVTDDVPEFKLAENVSSNNDLSLDSVIADLRKVVVTDFIKNPKLFRGNKDDVAKRLDEIDHLMQTAHVPDSNRLDLISFSLRGDALQWFRNNKSMLTSWSIFIQEIKKAFTSSFCEEVAFKTLESYTQGEKQSVRNFYNEILKLCKQADTSMSESTKLKNLLNKMKPTIQLEVHKKKPKTTTEFLAYAVEAKNHYSYLMSVAT